MNKGDKLKQVDFAENILENEPQIGLSLNWTDKGAKHTRYKLVLYLISWYNVILFGGLMLCVIDKYMECSQGIKEHQVGVLSLSCFYKWVI